MALPPSVASMLVPKVLRELEARFPEIILRVEDGLSLENGRSLEAALLDFGIVPTADELVDVDCEPLVQESLFLVERSGASPRQPATVTLGQVARLVDIAVATSCDVVGVALQGQDREDRLQQFIASARDRQQMVGEVAQVAVGGIADRDDATRPSLHLLDIR